MSGFTDADWAHATDRCVSTAETLRAYCEAHDLSPAQGVALSNVGALRDLT